MLPWGVVFVDRSFTYSLTSLARSFRLLLLGLEPVLPPVLPAAAPAEESMPPATAGGGGLTDAQPDCRPELL